VTIPNLPSFDQSAYNGRPRKIVPEAGGAPVGGSATVVKNALEVGKDFPPLNGINISTAPPSTPATAPVQLDRGVPPSQQTLLSSHQDPSEDAQQRQLPPPQQLGDDRQSEPLGSEQTQSSETEHSQLTAIFRPDEAGEWRERLNAMRQGSQNSHAGRASDAGLSDERHPSLTSGAASWDAQPREDDDDDDDGKEEEEDGEVDEVNVTGEGEDGKVWRARKTLRK
jgi:striatin 1/3/4